MATEVTNDLKNFHLFVGKKLNNGGAQLSPERVLAMWRETIDSAAAIQAGLDDVAAGRVTPLDEFDREFRQKHNIPQDA